MASEAQSIATALLETERKLASLTLAALGD
jgi:hypothetical protein